jgi:hypothetical protein
MMMFLKARQLGITTLFQALLSHRVFLYRNVNAPTGSAEPDKSTTASRTKASPSPGTIAPAVVTTVGSSDSSSISPAQAAKNIMPALVFKPTNNATGKPAKTTKLIIKEAMLVV